jgi:restriction system protein
MLEADGWDAEVSPPRRDFGLDIVCERPGRRLGIQVKMYGKGRPVNAQIVMQLYGAAMYQDCSDVMLVTDGRVLDDAKRVARKLKIEIRRVPASISNTAERGAASHVAEYDGWTFDRIWEEHVMPLAGQVLSRPDGSANEVVAVDWSGLTRRSSKGMVGVIDIEIFKWAIERLLNGEVVLRSEIDDEYPKRASSGVVLVLGSLPMFGTGRLGSKKGLRLGAGQ